MRELGTSHPLETNLSIRKMITLVRRHRPLTFKKTRSVQVEIDTRLTPKRAGKKQPGPAKPSKQHCFFKFLQNHCPGWCCHWLRVVRRHHELGEVICCTTSDIYQTDARCMGCSAFEAPGRGASHTRPGRSLQSFKFRFRAFEVAALMVHLRIGWRSTELALRSFRTMMPRSKGCPRASAA